MGRWAGERKILRKECGTKEGGKFKNPAFWKPEDEAPKTIALV